MNQLGITLNRRPYPRPFDLPNQPVPIIDAATARRIVEDIRGEQTVWLLELRSPIYDSSGEFFRQLEADGFTQRLVVYGDNPADRETLSRFGRAVADSLLQQRTSRPTPGTRRIVVRWVG